jgi:enoyl-CoA hydratase/carnithine racemase
MTRFTAASNVIVADIDDNGVALVEINRHHKRNSVDLVTQQALIDAFGFCRDRARAVILTGRGSAFCSGIDLKERNELNKSGDSSLSVHGGSMHTWIEVQDTIRTHPAVFIAAVNGYALGGGVTLINSCDLALAAEDAEIGMPELGFGMYPAMSGSTTQLRLLPKHAAWLVLTTERIDGRQAAEWGLVNRAVPAATLLDEARRLATKIAGFDPVALAWSKKALAEIPGRISDYRAALEFSDHISLQIRNATSAVAAGLDRFAAGERGAGQGT